MVDVGASKTSISIVLGTNPHFTREVQIGGADGTEVLTKRMGLTLKDAEKIKGDRRA